MFSLVKFPHVLLSTTQKSNIKEEEVTKLLDIMTPRIHRPLFHIALQVSEERLAAEEWGGFGSSSLDWNSGRKTGRL